MARTEPWYKNIWWSFRYSVPMVISATWDTYPWWPRKEEGRGYGISPWYVTLIWWLVGLPLFVVEQMSGYWATGREAWLRWIGCRALDLTYLLAHRSGLNDWINDHGRINYVWLPPDGQEHGINPADGFKEYGAWMRSDLVDKDPQKRTRFYVHVGGAMLALLLLALPLAAQSPVGVWTTTVERTVQGVPVTDAGVIILRADGAYTAARKRSWTEDGVRTGAYAYAEGRWALNKPAAADGVSILCVTRDDRAQPNCHPVAVTDSTLVWGGFTFRRGE